MTKLYTVITTIQEPTDCVVELVKRLADCGGQLVVAGDTKGPASFDTCNTTFLDISAQGRSGFALAEKLPTKHYARKNIGYLEAIRQGAECIYETDDDNRPMSTWTLRSKIIASGQVVNADTGWVNVYRYFSEENIWPRGLPLDEIQKSVPALVEIQEPLDCPIQQGLVDNAPDVDAIWRLVMDRPFEFSSEMAKTVFLKPGAWCPFNTQSTWWWPIAYPLLYIPSYCSFRMCDIWKSFVAQRCLWAMGKGIAFHASEVIQDRNVHDLNRDFVDEIPGYTLNNTIKETLQSLDLSPSPVAVAENMISCYRALVEAEIFPEKELDLIQLWVDDLKSIMS